MRRYIFILLAAPVLLTGCNFGPFAAGDPYNPYATLAQDPGRDSAAAARHNAQATRLMDLGQYDQAETELKLALDADLFNGPAHNNLGTVYLHRQDYYRAAWEFQYATKLMPHKAEPLYNLAMVYEAVGELDDSHEWYAKAHELSPLDIRITCSLARAAIRTKRTDDTTKELLQQVVLQAPTDQWRQWARLELIKLNAPTDIIIPLTEDEDT